MPQWPSPVGAVSPERGILKRGLVLPLTAATAGLTLVAVSAVLLFHDRSLPNDFGQIPEVVPAAAAPAVAVTTVITPSTTSPRTTAVATLTTTTAAAAITTAITTATAAAATARTAATSTAGIANEPFLPSRLSIQALGVSTSIQFVNSRAGALEVPEDPAQVGWWLGSALPGSPAGTTVIDGHIDSAVRGVGAFWHLSTLTTGAVVLVTGSAGRSVHYRVVARRVYVKHEGLPSSLFSRAGPPTLLLISCGGPFDADQGSYEDNIVVFAVPVQ